ncbi:MAG: TonB family protein [Acidobacteria bacterium]|nr:TonB family protein [Acidobacteriota bacterium]
MSQQDLHALLRDRAHVGEFPLGKALALAAGAHVIVLAALFFKPSAKSDADAVQVTWVNLPPAIANQSGGAEARTEGQETERVRRVDDVAAQQPVPKPSEQEDNPFAKSAKSVRSGENPDETSTGKQVKASKSQKPNPVSTPGTAGAGNASGLGQGSSIPGLSATQGVEGGVGLVAAIDGSFPYAWYLQQVQTRIVGNWQRLGGQGRVQIYFRITRDGGIDGARIEVPSGNGALDESALMAVRRSAPLPPLPTQTGDSLGVHFWFNYVGN